MTTAVTGSMVDIIWDRRKFYFLIKNPVNPLHQNFFQISVRGVHRVFLTKNQSKFLACPILCPFSLHYVGVNFWGRAFFFRNFWICFFERIFFARSHIMSTIDKRTFFSRRIIGAVPPTFPTKTSPKIARFAALGGENLRVFLGQRVVAFGGWRAPLGGHSDGHGYY